MFRGLGRMAWLWQNHMPGSGSERDGDDLACDTSFNLDLFVFDSTGAAKSKQHRIGNDFRRRGTSKQRGEIDIIRRYHSMKITKYDPNQLSLDLNFKQTIAGTARAIRESLDPQTVAYLKHNDIGACHIIALSIKAALADTGMGRDELVDRINGYFCRTAAGHQADPPECLKPLTSHQLNNYLSKPTAYRLPAYYLYAICHVLDTLEPIRGIAAAMGAEVISREDAQLLHLVKLQRAMAAGAALEKRLQKRLMN